MKQYQKILLRREGREVLGKHWSNLWLLILMLVATFSSIAFSEGSMEYLRLKMEDPYTNWVSISKASDDNVNTNESFNTFRDSLNLESNKRKYDYQDVLLSQYSHYTMMGCHGRNDYLSARFFENLNTPLLKAILNETMGNCRVDSLKNETMGFIITLGAAKRLGYDEEHLPAYINFMAYNAGADSLGLKLEDKEYLPVALPVLAVVNRLPNNAQMLSGSFLSEQLGNVSATDPFDFISHRKDYLRQLTFFVDYETRKAFEKFIPSTIPDSLRTTLRIIEAGDYYESMRSWKPGTILMISIGDGNTPLQTFQEIANKVIAHFPDETQVCRVFRLDTEHTTSPHGTSLSVVFKSLNHISEFEEFAKTHGIQLELELVHSKQNFNAVTVMAGILSAAMVIFSIICIIMFIVNMLQSYFQKVKRNVGTFKAFGMNGEELIHVYVLLLITIVCIAVIIALGLTWGIQCLLPILNIHKNGTNYLSVWNMTTYIAATVIIVSTVTTVIIVMTRLLSKTPGDLIYDRN